MVYLALTGAPQPRDALAALFWPDVSAADAKKNLRDLLFNLRPLVGPYLDIHRSTLAFQAAAPHQIDVLTFERLAAALADRASSVQLQQMAELYRGEFLPGWFVDDAPALDHWLQMKRTALHDLAMQTLERLVDVHRGEHDAGAALAVTARMLALEPWRESAHRQRMVLLAQQGQRAAALEQFETFRRVLAAELGAAPAPETLTLVEAIRSGGECMSNGATPHNLPRSLTPFQGRMAELTEITALLRNPAYPLVTLVGEGGVGKTRLALEAARELLNDFPDGVWLVSLAEMAPAAGREHMAEKLATEIGAAIGLSFQDVQAPIDHLATRLRDRTMLLVLDNAEQLAPYADVITALLSRVAHLRVLATARLPLNLQAEQLFMVKGMRTPGVRDDVQRAGLTGLWEYSSVQLFVDRARRVAPDFVWNRANADQVASICRLLEGLPLGLELAASLLRERSLPAVIAALQDSYAVLAADLLDVPPRHRSLQTVFDSSWQLLTPMQQCLLAECTIFADEFSTEAAAAIIGAPAAALTSLVEAALLQSAGASRFTMHKRVQEFAARRLADDAAALLRQRHSAYYLLWLTGHHNAIGNDPAILTRLHEDLANIQAAWTYAVEHRTYGAIVEAVETLAVFMIVSGMFAEAYRWFTAAVAVLEAAPPDETRAEWESRTAACGHVLAEVVYFAEKLGAGDQAQATVSRVIQIAANQQDPYLEAKGYHRLAALHYVAGELEGSRQAGLHCLALARRLHLPVLEARALIGLALVSTALNDIPAMHAYYQVAEPLVQAGNQRYLALTTAINLGYYYDRIGNLPAARTRYRQALTLSRELGSQENQATPLCGLGAVVAALGNVEEGAAMLQRALSLASAMGDRRLESSIHAEMALVWLRQGKFQQAMAAIDRSHRIAQDAGLSRRRQIALLRRGRIHLALRNYTQAQADFDAVLAMCGGVDAVGGPDQPYRLTAWAGRAAVALATDAPALALVDVAALLPALDQVLAGSDGEQFFVYHTCFSVLAHLGDTRATTVKTAFQAILHQQADRIEDAGERDRFLAMMAALWPELCVGEAVN